MWERAAWLNVPKRRASLARTSAASSIIYFLWIHSTLMNNYVFTWWIELIARRYTPLDWFIMHLPWEISSWFPPQRRMEWSCVGFARIWTKLRWNNTTWVIRNWHSPTDSGRQSLRWTHSQGKWRFWSTRTPGRWCRNCLKSWTWGAQGGCGAGICAWNSAPTVIKSK